MILASVPDPLEIAPDPHPGLSSRLGLEVPRQVLLVGQFAQ